MDFPPLIDESNNEGLPKIKIIVEDHGPGIPDIDKAVEYGYSTSKGLGAGLPGTKRLVHEFDIESEPGHTTVTIVLTGRRG